MYGTAPVLNGVTLRRPNTITERPEQVGDEVTLANGSLRRYDLGERKVFELRWGKLTEAQLAALNGAAGRGQLAYTHTDGVTYLVLADRAQSAPVPGTDPVVFETSITLREQKPRR